MSSVSFGKRIASRIGRKVTLILAMIIIVVEAIVLVPSYFGLRQDLLQDLREKAVSAFNAAIHAEMAMHEGKVTEVGSFLAKEGYLLGGTLYDLTGALRGSFGETPSLMMIDAREGKENLRLVEDGSVAEFYVPREETGLIFSAILRVETEDVAEQLRMFLINVSLIVLFLAITCIVGIAGTLDLIVLKRVLGMRREVTQAIDRPDIADQFVLRDRTKDEVGDLGRAIDMLLYEVSNTYQEDLAVAREITERSAIATLTYDRDGALINANEAALFMLHARDLEDLQNRNQDFIVLADKEGNASTPVVPSDLLKQGKVDAKGFALVDGTRVPCLIAGQSVKRGDGEIMRYFMTLINLSKQEDQLRVERDKRRAANNKIEELRAALAACVSLLSAAGPPPVATPDTKQEKVMPERLVGDWLAAQVRENRMDMDDLNHDVLPPVTAPEGLAEELFQNALSLAYLLGGGRTTIDIDAERNGGDLIDFRIAAKAKDPRAAKASPGQEAALVESAIGLLADRAGGGFTPPEKRKGTGTFEFIVTLRAAEAA